NATGLVRKLYSHPLISGLFPGSYNPGDAKNLPAYIPARTFAITLMDVLQPATVDSASGAAGVATPANPIAEFRKTVAALPDELTSVRTAMLSLMDAAGSDAAGGRQDVEDWYNSGMGGVPGWFKRATQRIGAGL